MFAFIFTADLPALMQTSKASRRNEETSMWLMASFVVVLSLSSLHSE